MPSIQVKQLFAVSVACITAKQTMFGFVSRWYGRAVINDQKSAIPDFSTSPNRIIDGVDMPINVSSGSQIMLYSSLFFVPE